MHLQAFRDLVDRTPARVGENAHDLVKLYDYVGLSGTTSFQRHVAEEALNERAREAFTSGRSRVAQLCRALRTDLIREHVILGAPLEPYFEVLDRMRSAVQSSIAPQAEPIVGNWETAITAIQDYVAISSWRTHEPEQTHARDYAVARAAKSLREAGFEIRLSPGWIGMEDVGEAKLIGALERLIAEMGGLNVVRRIYGAIAHHYDTEQQRHHLVPRPSLIGEQTPSPPWGYLLHLAIKHIEGRKPLRDSDENWRRLVALATAFGAVADVQPYKPTVFGTFNASALITFLQELALYDSMFRITQLRPSDVSRMARGMLDFMDLSIATEAGWSVEEALQVISYLMAPARGLQGPVIIVEKAVCRALPTIPAERVRQLLETVLAHGADGANVRFSRPVDAPTTEDRDLGATFFARPLLRFGPRRYVLIDRAACAPACLEALLTPLRAEQKRLDDKVGRSVERFLEQELASRNVTVRCGDYDHGKSHGECDLIVETPDTLIFFELKKKALTRRAKAGSDADLLLDLAGSLLAAQAQAGWHEIRIEEAGHLDLTRDKTTERVALADRAVEKVAIAMLDYGSFQDRIVLKHFLESSLNAEFNPVDPALKKRFGEINDSLKEIREQVTLKQAREDTATQPFFNCWFLSLPQLLVLLDGVSSAQEFREALWTSRHMTTGASDFYFELSYMRDLKQKTRASQ